ncbi:hypothetical protein E2I00_017667 [Balaenoptera physalus]|uniref:P-type ATPase C-terminal domain-containing protein n=1 Tax=Balaenoptera physalus TaxID=9770 RepID=A0A643CFV4_BALPH|nr:hypothetical protein E2I00_017667 [Balaenoptera physalus]
MSEPPHPSRAVAGAAAAICVCCPGASQSGREQLRLRTVTRSKPIWMLTGDKLETATCIAKSSHLVSRTQDTHVFRPEGRQASLAADFSVPQFKHIGRLLMVHGRSSYKRSAALSQFVMHRGLIISTMQAVFSSVFYFASVPLYQGFLMVGYATVYTMFPVFSLVLDQDVKPEMAMLYPELYRDLTKGCIRKDVRVAFRFELLSFTHGGILMSGALVLFESEFVHVVAISFTALVLTELLMVALTVRTWHWLMVVAELLSLGCYVASLAFLNKYFDLAFITTVTFVWKVSAITVVSCLPLYVLKYLKRKLSPPSYSKLSS